MCPPQVLFIPDRDHDAIPDGPAEVVLDGFTVAPQNYHNFANGLKFGPDGWLYGRCGGSCPGRIGTPGTPPENRIAIEGGIWRYHPRRKTVEVLCHGTTNPWGHDWDAMGEMFFINTVNGHLWHLIPGAHFKRPFDLDPNTKTFETIDMHADHWHFDTGGSWTKSRDGAANSFGGGHAHTGMMIYLGDNWPDTYRGNLFTFNIHGQRANQERLKRHGSGYIATHGEDILLASDPFFRGNDLSYGPDGAVFLIDWSDTGECHEHTGVHRNSGRIFKVVFEKGNDQHREAGRLDVLDNDRLVSLHTSKNEWFVRQSRLVLAERAAAGTGMEAAKRQLTELFSSGEPINACRALQTLHAMGGMPDEFLLQQLAHENEHVRVWAIRLLTDAWPIDDVFGPTAAANNRQSTKSAQQLIQRLCQIAAEDPSSLVRLALASTIQRLPVALRPQLAIALAQHASDADDHNLPLVVWYGIIPVAEEHPDELAQIAIASKWPKTQRLAARRLAERIEAAPKAVEQLVAHLAKDISDDTRRNILRGIEDGLSGWLKAPQPDNWPTLLTAIESTNDNEAREIVRNLGVVFGDGIALEEVRRIVLDESADPNVRRSALESMVQGQVEGLRETCMAVAKDTRLNVVAAEGLALFDDPEVATTLIKNYRKFRAPRRPRIVSLLVSRKSFATKLLEAIENGKIPANALTAFDVRQINALNDSKLDEQVAELWGSVRDSSADKIAQMKAIEGLLTVENMSAANKSKGRALFNDACSKCHRMYGFGETLGPNLTGANRNNVDYLLQNILDPSAVVSRDYRMAIVTTRGGQTFSGLIVANEEKKLTLQTQTDLKTIAAEEVESIEHTTLSPMPDRLLDNLTDKEIIDLFAYLMHPNQIELEK